MTEQMDDLDALFNYMDTASSSGDSGVFFDPGTYTVALKAIEYIPEGFKGKSCKFHFTVKTSSNADCPEQSTRSWIVKLDKTKDQNVRTLSDIKNMIFALLGQDPRELRSAEKNPKAHAQASALFKAAISPAFAASHNPPLSPKFLVGRECQLEAQQVPTKPKFEGGPAGKFTRHVWAPTPKTS